MESVAASRRVPLTMKGLELAAILAELERYATGCRSSCTRSPPPNFRPPLAASSLKSVLWSSIAASSGYAVIAISGRARISSSRTNADAAEPPSKRRKPEQRQRLPPEFLSLHDFSGTHCCVLKMTQERTCCSSPI